MLVKSLFLKSTLNAFRESFPILLICHIMLVCAANASAAVQNTPPKIVPPPMLVLAGGTIVDVTDWGRSANDIQDSIVFIRDGHILAVGTRATLPSPKGSQVIDCTGKYLIPGLIDGFAGMNSQGQASANLYMGVTTIVSGVFVLVNLGVDLSYALLDPRVLKK